MPYQLLSSRHREEWAKPMVQGRRIAPVWRNLNCQLVAPLPPPRRAPSTSPARRTLGNRLLLTNGVHRVCALHLQGLSKVPCLLRTVGRIEETGLNIQTSLFRPNLFFGERPAEGLDFFDSKVAAPLKMRSVHHVLRIGIGVEMIKVPAIPTFSSTPKSEPIVPKPNVAALGPATAERPSAPRQ